MFPPAIKSTHTPQRAVHLSAEAGIDVKVDERVDDVVDEVGPDAEHVDEVPGGGGVFPEPGPRCLHHDHRQEGDETQHRA